MFQSKKAKKRPRENATVAGTSGTKIVNQKKKGVNVAIIVPFRDLHVAQRRSEHLKKFVPHMEKVLGSARGIGNMHVFIAEQSRDNRKFNRGKLLNIGFKLAKEYGSKHGFAFDSFVFHDVDLLPHGDEIISWYARYPTNPIHIARCWDRYNKNDKYFGGVVAFSNNDFVRIDGFPNTFWGWGGEDDELQRRVANLKLKIDAPRKDLPGALEDLEGMDIKTKMDTLRKTNWKCMKKWETLEEYQDFRGEKSRPPWWGLQGAKYEVKGSRKIGPSCTVYTVDVLDNKESDGSKHWAPVNSNN